MSNLDSAIIRCPTCRQKGAWFASQWGPFCSQRCKWVDLGKWLDEEHRIAPEPLDPEELEHRKPMPPTHGS
ncbi:MAG: DNA gyrase inhibitor YacG [Verrucomicrobiales bacterium]|nr:DNA gyrase inhibitor YacG [Verrucomicrobiales bacterium]